MNSRVADRGGILVMRGREDQARKRQQRQAEENARHAAGQLGQNQGHEWFDRHRFVTPS